MDGTGQRFRGRCLTKREGIGYFVEVFFDNTARNLDILCIGTGQKFEMIAQAKLRSLTKEAVPTGGRIGGYDAVPILKPLDSLPHLHNGSRHFMTKGCRNCLCQNRMSPAEEFKVGSTGE
jgi:hypothetical protein